MNHAASIARPFGIPALLRLAGAVLLGAGLCCSPSRADDGADAIAAQPGRVRLRIDSGWGFLGGDHDGAQQVNYDARAWPHVELPHDWSVEQPVEEANPRNNGYFQRGVGWYRETLLLDRSFLPRQVYVEFEGVYRNSTFWVNGREVGRHLSGYTGVVYDITPYVYCDGRANLLALRVDGRENEGWWYEGSGIYRHVWLIATDRVHVANWGVFVTTPQVSGKSATIRVKTSLQNDNPTDQRCRVTTRVLDADGGTVASATSEETVSLRATRDISRELAVANPHLWAPDIPYLYRLRIEV